MAEVLAGIVCGYALALLVTPLAAVALIHMRVQSDWLRRLVPEETPLLAWSLVLHSFWFLVLTGAGMVLGLLLYGLEDSRPEAGLGSPNAAYTLVVVVSVAIAVLPMAAVMPRWRKALLVSGLTLALTYGWIVPYLAQIGPGKV